MLTARAWFPSRSGDELSHSALFTKAAATPYVYMAAQQNIAASPRNTPLTPARNLDDPSIFRKFCGGATIKQLHRTSARAFWFPQSGFEVTVADGFVSAQTVGFAREALFTFPLGAIARATLLRSDGVNASIWSLLCGCCFGSRQMVLALDLDAPAGWIQWEKLHGEGLTGPVRLGLQVFADADEYLDAMGVTLE